MAKIDGGCTLWARQTIDSEIFYYKPDKWFKIWFYLVSKVNHKDNKLFKRGEGLVTYEDIAYKTKATKTQIEKCLKWLRREGMLDERRTTRGNIKIVSKYDTFQDMKTYQKNGETNDKTIERRIEDEQKAVPINKNDKNVKNDKKDIKLHQKVDYLLNIPNKDINEFIGKFNVTEEIVKEKGEKFYYYCLSKGKDKGKDAYKNFKAALRNALSDFGKKLPEDVEMAKRIKATQEKSNISSPQSKELINKMKA